MSPTHGSLTKAGKVRNQVLRDLGFSSPQERYEKYKARRKKKSKFPRMRNRVNFKKRFSRQGFIY